MVLLEDQWQPYTRAGDMAIEENEFYGRVIVVASTGTFG